MFDAAFSDVLIANLGIQKRSTDYNGTIEVYPYNKLQMKILCETHNNLLSPFDSDIARFLKIITLINKSITDIQIKKQLNTKVSYFRINTLERALIKICIGLIKSNTLQCNEVDSKFLHHLFNNTQLANDIGLFFNFDSHFEFTNEIYFKPLKNSNNDLMALECSFNGLLMLLILRDEYYYYSTKKLSKPKKLLFVHNNLEFHTINFIDGEKGKIPLTLIGTKKIY